jgi:diguanylate cyclase (GGDEF)-like protein
MRVKKTRTTFAPHEVQRFILPVTTAFICIIGTVLLEQMLTRPRLDTGLIVYGISAILYAVLNNILLVHTQDYQESYGLVNAILSGIWLGLFAYMAPPDIQETAHILILLGIIAVAIVSGRFYSYLTLVLAVVVSFLLIGHRIDTLQDFFLWSAPYIIGIVVIETVIRIKDTTRQEIHRLETINNISRQIMLSLDVDQTIAILNANMQEALEADTYILGTVREDEIYLPLFYDDGQYFQDVRIPLEGTLSGWVIRNERELFLPDLRKNVQMDGVGDYIVGKEKTSLSWVGVPLKASNLMGIIALGAYQPNAFDSGDVELLSNLAQHVSLALDNAYRHAQVEEQARLDSMTGVLNHGYFLKRLAEQAQTADQTQSQVSLIMLDIDHFKQYNDTYGHLVGDRILKALCAAIRRHVKQTDAIGRWGGEEFAISLPGASGAEALLVAERIRLTMASLQVEDRDQRTMPVPTVSQGIAVYPQEADEIYRLVDLADYRLYIAKARGRNQVEPSPILDDVI